MMDVVLKVMVERVDGLNRSRELVEQALSEEVDALQLDVEDSEYEIADVEVLAELKSMRQGSSAATIKAIAERIVWEWNEVRGTDELNLGEGKVAQVPARPKTALEHAIFEMEMALSKGKNR
jgi:hypothetical protein